MVSHRRYLRFPATAKCAATYELVNVRTAHDRAKVLTKKFNDCFTLNSFKKGTTWPLKKNKLKK